MNPRLLNIRLDILWTVVQRELRELTRNRVLVAAIVIPPLIMVIVPLLASKFATGEPLPPDLMANLIASRPAWASFTAAELQAAFALQQMVTFFLLLPATIPLAIAAYSIVGEKQTRSLEAVIAAPIRTSELLAGKVVAAIVPGVVAVWTAYLVLVGLSAVLMGADLASVITDPTWLAAVFVLGPAIGLASVVVGVIISSRVSDPRAAQQLGTVLILPIVGFAVLQAQSGTLYTVADYIRVAGLVTLMALIGLRAGVGLFGRETILLRWR